MEKMLNLMKNGKMVRENKSLYDNNDSLENKNQPNDLQQLLQDMDLVEWLELVNSAFKANRIVDARKLAVASTSLIDLAIFWWKDRKVKADSGNKVQKKTSIKELQKQNVKGPNDDKHEVSSRRVGDRCKQWKEECKTTDSNDTIVPTFFRIFYCYQNEAVVEKEVEKNEPKISVNYQKSERISHGNKAFDLGYGYQNRLKIEKMTSVAGVADMEERRDNDGNDEVIFDQGKADKLCDKKSKAFDNYQKPVNTAHIGATWDLKRCYQKDIDVTKDESKVITHRLDINQVGEINSYEKGIGVEMDGHKTLNFYQRFALDECEAFEGQLKNTKEVLGSTGKGTVKDERMAFKWNLKSAESKKLPESYESFEAAFKMSSCNVLNESAKSNKEGSLNNNDLQEMCDTWMDKVARINDPPSSKKRASEVSYNKRMMRCKDSGYSPSFNNDEVEDIKVNGMLMDDRKVKVELWIFLTLMKLHMMNDLIRRADKDRIGDLVERPFKKNNLGDRGKKKKKK
ncbi:hypothetical protein C2G38_2203446 [Gigaspora rosea]|uniref:Uncharacterized protein n=1 Tax=Gigaspora rosea TaxID=44941 RepID=A0A397UMF7_9GLOM|nr:hypothetical protein C2G38_2203446 [Gigaspora rosea]